MAKHHPCIALDAPQISVLTALVDLTTNASNDSRVFNCAEIIAAASKCRSTVNLDLRTTVVAKKALLEHGLIVERGVGFRATDYGIVYFIDNLSSQARAREQAAEA